MDLHTFLIMLHLLGFAFGVGGATASDLTFIRSTKDGSVKLSEYNIIKTLSYLVWTSVFLVLLSGVALMGLEYHEQGVLARLDWSFFQIKMTAVGALIINGTVFHYYVFPLLKQSIGKSFRSKYMRSKYKLFAFTGAVSIVSWYTAFLSVAFSGFVNELPYLALLSGYGFLIASGALFAYSTLNMHADETNIIKAVFSSLRHPFSLAMILTAALLFIATVLGFMMSS